MSKERAQRRAEREREAAIKAAARARAEERRQRAVARRRRLTGWVPRPRFTPGILARKRRINLAATIGILVFLNVILWIVSYEWSARVGGIIVSILAAPVLYTMLFRSDS
jgi:membrane associated rhomboid family serine protease